MNRWRLRVFARALVVSIVGVGVVVAVGGCKKKQPEARKLSGALQLQLLPAQTGEARIRYELIEDGTAQPVIDMHLPWKILRTMADGTTQVGLGPPTFPGATTPAWPAGSTVTLQLDAYDRDSHWMPRADFHSPVEAQLALEKALLVRYATGAGIIALPTTPTKVGGTWDADDPPAGGVHTHRQSKLLSFDGERARIAVTEDSTVDDSPASEHVRGEIVYALDQPLPVGGWLRIESHLADGHQRTIAYLYGNKK
ncbi:MAG TPA: hypothetical protein VIA18_25370 [Polyangia bacterium]|nr:hypothetical protein [Polyangia bacterium]